MTDAVSDLRNHSNAQCRAFGFSASVKLGMENPLLMEYESEMEDYYGIIRGVAISYNRRLWVDWSWSGSFVSKIAGVVAHEEAHAAGMTDAEACYWENTCSPSPIPGCSH